MKEKDIQKLRSLSSFEALIDYLRDEYCAPFFGHEI